eukprot:641281-Prorocentrum_minimum.AAC.1
MPSECTGIALFVDASPPGRVARRGTTRYGSQTRLLSSTRSRKLTPSPAARYARSAPETGMSPVSHLFPHVRKLAVLKRFRRGPTGLRRGQPDRPVHEDDKFVVQNQRGQRAVLPARPHPQVEPSQIKWALHAELRHPLRVRYIQRAKHLFLHLNKRLRGKRNEQPYILFRSLSTTRERSI